VWQRIVQAGLVLGLGGAVGPVFQGAYARQGGPFGFAEWYRNYQVVSDACLAIRKDLFERAGRFDERYGPTISALDLCRRVSSLGIRHLYTPFARLAGDQQSARPIITGVDDQRTLDGIWTELRGGDPSFNPNLSLTSLVPVVATPHTPRKKSKVPVARKALGAPSP
jgi:hypothetical protein